jgi:NhaC family Na+:H+ antiporter
MAGVLGVATAAYLPYAFFNLLSPLISLIYGFTGFRIEHIEPPAEAPGPAAAGPGPSDQLTEGSPS